MRRRTLTELASNPNLISGVYNTVTDGANDVR